MNFCSARRAPGRVQATIDSEPNRLSAERARLNFGRSALSGRLARPRKTRVLTNRLQRRRHSRQTGGAISKTRQRTNRTRRFLTAWETTFVSDLIARGTRWPSPKQAVVILRILEKADAFSTASADADWEDVP